MDVLYRRCAGLDVHKDSVVAAVRLAGDEPARTEVRGFGTTTPELLKLPTWLGEAGCTTSTWRRRAKLARAHAMRSMAGLDGGGVYWKPVWHVLSDGDVTPILTEAMHVENVPGRKTALVRCAWAATRKKGSYLQAQFQRLRHRRGPKKAVCAVAASMITAAFHMLRDGTLDQDLGPDPFQTTSPESRANRLARQIQKLGFACTAGPASPERVSI